MLQQSKRSGRRKLLLFGVGCLVSFMGLKEATFDIARVSNQEASLAPLIECGDVILTTKLFKLDQIKGKVVLFTEPRLNQQQFRVVHGLPSDWVQVDNESRSIIVVPNGSIYLSKLVNKQEDDINEKHNKSVFHDCHFISLVHGLPLLYLYPFNKFGLFKQPTTNELPWKK